MSRPARVTPKGETLHISKERLLEVENCMGGVMIRSTFGSVMITTNAVPRVLKQCEEHLEMEADPIAFMKKQQEKKNDN